MPYAQLSEEMKEYDRVEARNSLAAVADAMEKEEKP
ncbi:MAG: hypothetical protein FD189_1068 [Elusimicrobia bacterium]|nr:MAG: hypothetical protein FD189_1068 [Elusimicrobiota bacterium]